MNWDAISTIAESVGAVAVVGSLLFLALETRKNTKTARASLSNDSLTATAELNDVILADAELRRIVSKATNPNIALEEYSEDERDAVIYLARALFMRYEGLYMLYRQGLVELDLWEGRKALMSGLLQLPVWEEYWEQEQKNSIFTSRFTDTVNSAVAAKNIGTPLRETPNLRL